MASRFIDWFTISMVHNKINSLHSFLLKNKFFVLIILLGLFLRLFNLPNSIGFAWDQERDAFAVKQIIIDKRPVLIGPRVVNDQGFMLGPYFFYLLAPFYLLAKLSPYAIILFITFYFIVFLTSSYLVFKKIFSQKIAFIFILVWSILPLAVSIDTISWNPLLVPLLLVFLLYFLNTLDFNKSKNWLFLGFYLGFSSNIHVQLFILSFISFVFFLIKKPKTNFLINILFSILGFSISFLPLMIFDLRHNFLNLNLFLNFFKSISSSENPVAFIPVWTNYISNLIFIKSDLSSIMFWAILCLISYIYSKKNIFNKALFFTWIFFPIIFIVYQKRPSEYYFNFCLPIIILIFSQSIAKIKINPKLSYVLLAMLILSSVYFKFRDKTIASFSLANKIKVIKYIGEVVKDKKFNLSYSVPAGQNSGYSYLMDYYKIKPTNNFNDPLIEIIIPSQEIYPTFGDISLKIPPPFNK